MRSVSMKPAESLGKLAGQWLHADKVARADQTTERLICDVGILTANVTNCLNLISFDTQGIVSYLSITQQNS